MSQKQRLFRLNSKSWSTSTLRSIANLLRSALYITKCGRTGNECGASCWIGVVLHWVYFMNWNICAYNISIVKPVVSRLHNELTSCIERANCSSCVHFFFRYFFYTAAHAYLNDYLHCWNFIVFFLFFSLLLFDIVAYHSQECKWRWSVCQSFYQLLFSCWPLNIPQVSLPNPFQALRVTIF